MSKIAEKKALKAYPNPQILPGFDENKRYREGYVVGYDQAMQDFFEYLKHCSTFTDMNGKTIIDNDLHNILIEQFKNYMQNEM